MAESESCLFCKIIGGEIPATVVAETPRALAFRDLNPQAPTHVLVTPRPHYATVAELAADADLLAEVVNLAHAVAEQEGVAESGYRLAFNTGRDGGQAVFHVHGHVLGGRVLGRPSG